MTGPRLVSSQLATGTTAREVWDDDDAAHKANAEQAWLDRWRQARANGLRVNVDQGIYTVSTKAAQLDFDLLTTDRRSGETHAELTVYLADAVNLGKMLHKGRLNLLSGDRRERLARYLAGRTKELEIDWADLLEEAVTAVVGLYRAGEPAILLRDAPIPETAGQPLIDPILAADGPTGLFGDGGAAKSLTALALGVSLHTGETVIDGLIPAATRRVGYLDWEWSAHVHRGRLERLWDGRGELPDLVYVACRSPIREERDRLRRIIRDHRLEYLIIDSVGLACALWEVLGHPDDDEHWQLYTGRGLERQTLVDALLVAIHEGRFHFAPALAEQEAMSKALLGYRRQVREDGLIGSELVVALLLAIVPPRGPSIYESRGLLVLGAEDDVEVPF